MDETARSRKYQSCLIDCEEPHTHCISAKYITERTEGWPVCERPREMNSNKPASNAAKLQSSMTKEFVVRVWLVFHKTSRTCSLTSLHRATTAIYVTVRRGRSGRPPLPSSMQSMPMRRGR